MIKKLNILILLAAVLLPMSRAGGATAIRVLPSVEVDDVEVRLGDIAQVRADSSEQQRRLEELVVLSAPNGSVVGKVDVFAINRALSSVNIAPASVDVYGSSMCEISFAVEAEEEAEAAEPMVVLPAGPGEFSYTLADELGRLVSNSAAIGEAYLAVDWICNDSNLLCKEFVDGAFEIVPRSPLTLGRVVFDVTEPGGGRSQRVYGDVQYQCQSVVAAVPLRAGQVIGLGDVKLVSRRISSLSDIGYTDVELVVGQEVARPIRPNDLITDRLIKLLQMVKAKEIVDVVAQTGPVQITLRGRALSNGAMGDMVSVRDERNQKVIQGVVSGAGEVTVTSPAHQKEIEYKQPAKVSKPVERVEESDIRWES